MVILSNTLHTTRSESNIFWRWYEIYIHERYNYLLGHAQGRTDDYAEYEEYEYEYEDDNRRKRRRKKRQAPSAGIKHLVDLLL